MYLYSIVLYICRHALALASKHGKHDMYLAIMVEVEVDHKAALAYMEKLPPWRRPTLMPPSMELSSSNIALR